MSKPQSMPSWAGSRILLSFLSALAGWVAGMLFFAICSLGPLAIESKELSNFKEEGLAMTYKIEDLLVIGYCMGIVILVTWFFVLIPLALFVPARLPVWKPWILTFIGVVTGPVIILTFGAIEGLLAGVPISERLAPNLGGILFFGLPTIIVGATTGYFAALFNHRSLQKNAA